MAYSTHTTWKDRPGAVAGVIAVHAALGYALVTGLSFTGIVEKLPKLVGETIVDPVPIPPVEPPPQPKVEPQDTAPQIAPAPAPFVPKAPIELGPRTPIETSDVVLPPLDLPSLVPGPAPSASAGPKVDRFKPVAATPRNNAGTWITEADYRSNWIRQELTGVARFRLDISASGQVTGCTITSSSGHSELDNATCALITRRAKFKPAKDGNGDAVASTFSNAVEWKIPD
ncbi:energy transducer TonB [Altererythrobacter sp. FM1]|uniref:Energy transducer TonB n=1 Tax=Tsuneonella flava TaxID=2055955 RepID=A0ABX7K8D8_9SPHN|nr:energy transducer TonB [Tsuneonella flava]QSB43529.1 energy transducer TonB [Tsuneonella flava]ROT94882.1 energy transducer TonB [Altererythrobacter sp. FM1]